MKKIAYVALAASVAFSPISHAKVIRLPFVGTKYFDFYTNMNTKGVCAGDVIRISRNGSVFVGPEAPCPGIRAYYYNRGKGYYEGKYNYEMRVKTYDGTVYHYHIENGKIYRLDSRKRLERNCNGEFGNSCIAYLYDR